MVSVLRIINSNYTNPSLNLALEESIFWNSIENNASTSLRIWKNQSSVILGRSQVVDEEVNVEYCKENNIGIFRRFTGGGTVYQDLGNINTSIYTRISKIPTPRSIVAYLNYFRNLLADVLREMNYTQVSVEGSSNIFVEKKKVSGAAASLSKGWFIFHASMLVNADLYHLENSLVARTKDPPSKRQSRYFPTHNLDEIFPFVFDVNKWEYKVAQKLKERFETTIEYSDIKKNELQKMKELRSKYQLDEWNYLGKTP